MEASSPLSLVFLLICTFSFLDVGLAAGSADGSEQWGYADVRPKAHMFWWLYRSPMRVDTAPTPWPTILWLQGGPGASGVGLGNFEELGPLDRELEPRNSTWLRIADLLFVDSPVGTGFSYVDGNDPKQLVHTDDEAAVDLVALLKHVYGEVQSLRSTALYIFAESYGGKFAVTLSLAILRSLHSGDLDLNFRGVAVGNSWISPQDFVFSWGPLLFQVSRIDGNGLVKSHMKAEHIKELIDRGYYSNATDAWGDHEMLIDEITNGVDFYNFLLDSSMDPLTAAATSNAVSPGASSAERYSRYLSSKAASNSMNITTLMNGVIREKLQIVPKNVTWVELSESVFNAMYNDFMKPRISEVDDLLSQGVNFTIYNGQLDLICATSGVEAWVNKLKWEGLGEFMREKREALYCGKNKEGGTKGFLKSYKNLHFYWILGAGHYVPFDQPCIALEMVKEITQSPAALD